MITNSRDEVDLRVDISYDTLEDTKLKRTHLLCQLVWEAQHGLLLVRHDEG